MPEYNGGGGGGGGGGSGEKKAAPSHASGDGDEGAKYEALALELPEEPMTRLTVGGETHAPDAGAGRGPGPRRAGGRGTALHRQPRPGPGAAEDATRTCWPTAKSPRRIRWC